MTERRERERQEEDGLNRKGRIIQITDAVFFRLLLADKHVTSRVLTVVTTVFSLFSLLQVTRVKIETTKMKKLCVFVY